MCNQEVFMSNTKSSARTSAKSGARTSTKDKIKAVEKGTAKQPKKPIQRSTSARGRERVLAPAAPVVAALPSDLDKSVPFAPFAHYVEDMLSRRNEALFEHVSGSVITGGKPAIPQATYRVKFVSSTPQPASEWFRQFDRMWIMMNFENSGVRFPWFFKYKRRSKTAKAVFDAAVRTPKEAKEAINEIMPVNYRAVSVSVTLPEPEILIPVNLSRVTLRRRLLSITNSLYIAVATWLLKKANRA